MKGFIAFFVIISLHSIALAAGKDKKASSQAKAAIGGKLELARGGLSKVTIEAPDGAIVKESSTSGVEITAGNRFQLQVSKSKADIADLKKEISANEVNKLKRFHIDSPDELLYESSAIGTEFHFVANVKVGSDIYSCEDIKGPTFTKSDVETMLKACHSILKK